MNMKILSQIILCYEYKKETHLYMEGPTLVCHYFYFVSWCGFSYARNTYKDFWIGETAEKNGSLLASLEMIVSLLNLLCLTGTHT